ncbi:DUF6519 domain-containing protein [Amycolatopsis sp. NPDC059657]|uniref:DUF6519 domain-containing protein n=1 Tax=Amycolatopsis sp. NPDC059657 TaxID=3346899 RepID=UPI0036712553
MQADLSRLIFRPEKRFSAVVTQQGRVRLDSEDNEQSLIALHTTRTLAADLIGRHGGPLGALGFGIGYVPKGKDPADLTITAGRYYVDGIGVDAAVPPVGVPVEDEDEPGTAAAAGGWTYWTQPDAYRDPEREKDLDHLPDLPFLAYLKVTERLVTYLQDPEIRETALGTTLPDTSARLKVTWQVLPLTGLTVGDRPTKDRLRTAFDEWARGSVSTGKMAARTEKPAKTDDNPCVTPPDSRYRGPENQLYRVEVHRGGEKPTFKWSRENASVTFGISAVEKSIVTLTDLGRDAKLDLDIGDWVEVVDDAYDARGVTLPLLQVVDIDTERLRVELSGEPHPSVGRLATRHPFLRRWDHRAPTGRGAQPLDQGAVSLVSGQWLDLEDGVQAWFTGGTYHAGDYWLIAARTLNGDVEWPRDARGRPLLQKPRGLRHHYAPLAWVHGGEAVDDLRLEFKPAAEPRP